MNLELLMRQLLRRASRIGLWWKKPPPGWPYDPYAWKPAPKRPRPTSRSGAVAVAEPDED